MGNNMSSYSGCRGSSSRITRLGVVDDSVVVCGVGELDADASTVYASDEEIIGG